MSKVFFTSDLHFGHENLCKELRGMTAEESDSLIISNWNEVVRKNDIVYVLGDFTMEKPTLIEQYIKQLSGTIIIIGGNHDNLKCSKEFMRLGIPVMGSFKYKGFMCTHIPIHINEMHDWNGCLHGHIHIQKEIKPEVDNFKDKYYNVNTEFHNYKPVCFEEIRDYFTKIKI